jgi:hypothetical protein
LRLAWAEYGEEQDVARRRAVPGVRVDGVDYAVSGCDQLIVPGVIGVSGSEIGIDTEGPPVSGANIAAESMFEIPA